MPVVFKDGEMVTISAVEFGPIPTVASAPLRLSFLQFMDLFTIDEQIALAGAAMTDAATKLWYDRAVGAQFIDFSDLRLAQGLQTLVDSGIITAARRDRVLTGEAAEA